MQTEKLRRTTRVVFMACAMLLSTNWGIARSAGPALLTRQDPTPAAQAPATPPQSTPPPAAASPGFLPPSPHSVHARSLKIWTNEDLIGTRTPADIYMFAKEAKAAADQAAAFQTLTSCFAPNQPEATAEDTQKAIEETTQSIQEADNGIAQAKRQVAEDPEGLRTRDQAELNRRTAERNRLLERLHTLQDRLQQMTPTPPSDKASAPEPGAPAPTPQQ
jgi:hypothetical protein